jgi:hypothetical protein
MLLDLGADCSLLPEAIVQKVGAKLDRDSNYEISGYDGNIRITPTVIAQVVFCGKAFHGRYAITSDEIGILGRDVLNHLRLTFHGPETFWSESKGQ